MHTNETEARQARGTLCCSASAKDGLVQVPKGTERKAQEGIQTEQKCPQCDLSGADASEGAGQGGELPHENRIPRGPWRGRRDSTDDLDGGRVSVTRRVRNQTRKG